MKSSEANNAARASWPGWRSRGYLPHFDGGDQLPQSITFRLVDSVPAKVIELWLAELQAKPATGREMELRRRIEKYLDSGYGACHLRNARIGSLVEDALLFFDSERYRLHAWVVMPNHVHALFTPTNGWGLAEILRSWKSFTSKEANKLLGQTGHFWQPEYFDRFIRDAAHFDNVVGYIENHPVKAGLCGSPSDWRLGSARLKCHTEAVGTTAVPG
jgi:REP element-mobilizing transposase RayT